jgi:hypothetical protein
LPFWRFALHGLLVKVTVKVMDTHIHRSIRTHFLTRANATAIPVLARTNITQINIIKAARHVRHLATTRVTTLATIRTPVRTGLARTMIHAEIAAIQATAHTRFQLQFRTNASKGTADIDCQIKNSGALKWQSDVGQFC